MREGRYAPRGLVDLIEPALLGGVVHSEGAKRRGFALEFGNTCRKLVQVFPISALEIVL